MSGTKRIVRKLFFMLITILCVLIFNYILFRLLPGNYLTKLSRASKASASQLKALEAYYGLDGTWWEQFVNYLDNLLHLDLGTSYTFNTPVWQEIKEAVGPTVLLLGIAEVIAIIVGITFGVITAWKRGKRLDKGMLTGSLLFYSMPTFWLGMILILIFCSTLKALPTGGMVTAGMYFKTSWARVQDTATHLVLPVACIALGMIGEYCITMRSTMIDVLSEDYMTTAKAKGFPQGYLLRKHALPNAMLPMVTMICMNLGFIIAGAVQVETMFSWPGLGSLIYTALDNRDYTLLQGLFLFTTIATVLANFLADILYQVIDPRIKNS